MRAMIAIIGTAVSFLLATGGGAVRAADAPDAAAVSPVGLWRTIDDTTGKPRGLVRIVEQDGKLFGKIEGSANPGAKDEICDKCSDERKGQPKIGLTIIRAMQKDGAIWSGGDILDPDNGKVYKCKMTLAADGKKLDVRGFIGFSLLGRTQVWERVE